MQQKMTLRIRGNEAHVRVAHRMGRWVLAGFCFGMLNGAVALAIEPTLHHSVTITGVVTEVGKNGKDTGETVISFNNAKILSTALENSPPSNTKVSDLDIVEEDDSGQLTIIYKSNSVIFATLGDTNGATESTSLAFNNVTSYLLYRIYSGYTLNLPFISPGASISIQFANHLDKHSNFTMGTGTFFGGVSYSYLVHGQITTGSRVYTFMDTDD